MNLSSHELIEFIRNLTAERKVFAERLQLEQNQATVYYLTPYSNLVRIWKSGGIRPRNYVDQYVDLSAHGIQNKRDRAIFLFCDCAGKEVKLHDSINFFFNPFNFTYYQFRRNALIRGQQGDPWSRLVCILEIDLIKLFTNYPHAYWGITGRNATRQNVKITNYQSEYRNFNWRMIYSFSENGDKGLKNSIRSAECIVYPGSKINPPVVSTDNISRILVLDEDLKRLNNTYTYTFPVEMTELSQRNLSQSDPLYIDKKWVLSLYGLFGRYKRGGIFLSALSRILFIEDEIGLQLRSAAFPPFMLNSGIHGTGHVIRVIFWVSLLAGISNELGYDIPEDEKKVALYAAFLHDAGRTNNAVDENHGAIAAERFKSYLQTILPLDFSQRCLTAIRVHSTDVDPQTPDIVWMLLKDADALDRGRFSPPYRNDGCDPGKFRISLLREKEFFIENLMWNAYWFARVTRYINWSEHPLTDFLETILSSLNLVAESQGFGKLVRDFARELSMALVTQVIGDS